MENRQLSDITTKAHEMNPVVPAQARAFKRKDDIFKDSACMAVRGSGQSARCVLRQVLFRVRLVNDNEMFYALEIRPKGELNKMSAADAKLYFQRAVGKGMFPSTGNVLVRFHEITSRDADAPMFNTKQCLLGAQEASQLLDTSDKSGRWNVTDKQMDIVAELINDLFLRDKTKKLAYKKAPGSEADPDDIGLALQLRCNDCTGWDCHTCGNHVNASTAHIANEAKGAIEIAGTNYKLVPKSYYIQSGKVDYHMFLVFDNVSKRFLYIRFRAGIDSPQSTLYVSNLRMQVGQNGATKPLAFEAAEVCCPDLFRRTMEEFGATFESDLTNEDAFEIVKDIAVNVLEKVPIGVEVDDEEMLYRRENENLLPMSFNKWQTSLGRKNKKYKMSGEVIDLTGSPSATSPTYIDLTKPTDLQSGDVKYKFKIEGKPRSSQAGRTRTSLSLESPQQNL